MPRFSQDLGEVGSSGGKMREEDGWVGPEGKEGRKENSRGRRVRSLAFHRTSKSARVIRIFRVI